MGPATSGRSGAHCGGALLILVSEDSSLLSLKNIFSPCYGIHGGYSLSFYAVKYYLIHCSFVYTTSSDTITFKLLGYGEQYPNTMHTPNPVYTLISMME